MPRGSTQLLAWVIKLAVCSKKGKYISDTLSHKIARRSALWPAASVCTLERRLWRGNARYHVPNAMTTQYLLYVHQTPSRQQPATTSNLRHLLVIQSHAVVTPATIEHHQLIAPRSLEASEQGNGHPPFATEITYARPCCSSAWALPAALFLSENDIPPF